MSDQLTAAAQAMNVPEPIVERSARARAEASGSSYDQILAAWAGGEETAVAAPPQPVEEAPAETPPPEPEAGAAEEPRTAPAEPAPEPASVPVAAAVAVEEEAEPVEPLPLRERVALAGRIGAWTGGLLGLFGFVLASTWMLGVASVAGEEGAYGPAVEVVTSRVLLAVTVLSVVFGVVVASFSRAAAAWFRPGARLEGRFTATVALGAVVGLVLGVTAGAVMTSAFAEPIEGGEGLVLMRVIPGILVVLIGGALLGWVTAALVQVIGVPAGIQEEIAAEVADVRGRLTAALSIPMAAILLLLVLVLPLGLVFIRTNEMAGGGAAILAIFTALAILGIASLSASRPTMRVGLGELLVAAAGIATVVLIIFAVFQTRAGSGGEAEEGEGETTETTVVEDQAADGGQAALRLHLS